MKHNYKWVVNYRKSKENLGRLIPIGEDLVFGDKKIAEICLVGKWGRVAAKFDGAVFWFATGKAAKTALNVYFGVN